MHKLSLLLALCAVTVQLPIITGNSSSRTTKETKNTNDTISELIRANNEESNEKLKQYFTDYPRLINARPIEDLKNNQKNPVGLPIYLALIYNNDKMVSWLLDNGAKLDNNVFLTLFLQKVLTSDNEGFTKHFEAIVTRKPAIIQQKMSFNGEKLTPLDYATKTDNKQAVEFMIALLNKK